MLFEMWRDYRWCSPWNFVRLFVATHVRSRNAVCPIKLRYLKEPVYVRARTSDCILVRTVLTKLGGEYPVFKDYHPRVIIDAGANVGYATVFFKTYYPDATVVAIEPDEDNCRMFLLNTKQYADVHLLRGGLWPDSGKTVRISNPDSASWAFQCEPAENGVPTYAIADICRQFGFSHIDIMKIDIEGNERELFQRNTDWLAITDNIFMELHDHVSPGASRQVLRTIADQDFSLRIGGENLILTKTDLLWLDRRAC